MNTKQLQELEAINKKRRDIWGNGCEVHFQDDALGVLVFIQTRRTGSVSLVGFSAKRTKPDFNYLFANQKQAEKYHSEWLDCLKKTIETKEARKAEKAAKLAQGHDLIVGDVLVAMWGYDQTNYDYYQVTRLIGKRSVEICELKKSTAATGDMQGDCVPVKNCFIGEPMIKRVDEQNAVKVFSWGVWARKKESVKVGDVELFKPDHFTSYA